MADTQAQAPEATETTQDEQVFTVSAVFQPDSTLLPTAPDIVLLSTDRVFFHVHSDFLRQHSNNNFKNLLPAPPSPGEAAPQRPPIPVSEDSQVLNVVLHTIYGLPCGQFNPSNTTLGTAVGGLHEYGIALDTFVVPGTPLFALLAARTPADPLLMYALAGQFDLHALAVHASPHLLSTRPADIPPAVVDCMGPVYLQRLLALRELRVHALKDILRALPERHPETDACDPEAQARLAKAWELTAAYLIWEAKPELTATSMEVTFENVGVGIQCNACRAAFDERLAKALHDWAQVKRTID